MAERSRSSFKTQYTTNSGSYPFRDNTTKAITATVMRTHSTDIPDSHVMFEDMAPITASGTDTYIAAASPTLPAYTNTRLWLVLFTNANTGAATLNIDSKGAKAITKNGTTALVAGDISAGGVYFLAYDGTRFQIVKSSFDPTVSVSAADFTQRSGVKNAADQSEASFRFLFYAGSGATFTQDVNGSLLLPDDSVLTMTVNIQGVAADGSAGISSIKIASFRKDGSGDIVQIGSTTSLHSVEDSGDTPTTTLTTNGTGPKYIRATGDSNSATVYHWTVWADVSITKV